MLRKELKYSSLWFCEKDSLGIISLKAKFIMG